MLGSKPPQLGWSVIKIPSTLQLGRSFDGVLNIDSVKYYHQCLETNLTNRKKKLAFRFPSSLFHISITLK